MQRLLLEAPALPQPAAASLFRELLRAGPAWVNAALSTVLAGITARPPDRCAGSRSSVSICEHVRLASCGPALFVPEHVLLLCRASSTTTVREIWQSALVGLVFCACVARYHRHRILAIARHDASGCSADADAPCRIALAEVALNAATDADEAVRNRGVRLVANKLYGNQDVPDLTAQVHPRSASSVCRCAEQREIYESESRKLPNDSTGTAYEISDGPVVRLAQEKEAFLLAHTRGDICNGHSASAAACRHVKAAQIPSVHGLARRRGSSLDESHSSQAWFGH